MENNFNTPAQVFEANMKAGEGKVQLPLLKCILLGLMAGAFIAFGGATSSAAIHNIQSGCCQGSCRNNLPCRTYDDCICRWRVIYR